MTHWISSAARGPDTIGTLSVAARMQAPTIEAFAELASSSEVPKIQGAMNRYAPSDTVAHLRHLVALHQNSPLTQNYKL